MRRSSLLLIAGLALVLAACSGGDDAGATSPPSGDAPRTVSATLSDDMAIQLSESDFRVGETIRFEHGETVQRRHEDFVRRLWRSG